MLRVVAHQGGGHLIALPWRPDPVIAAGLTVAVVAYWRGRRLPADSRARQAGFAAGMVAVALALLSPLDHASAELASAHMVQHVLLVVVAAPLLALSAPGAALARGSPVVVRRAVARARRTAGLDAPALRRLRHPVPRWLAYVATLWLWHSAVLYEAAVEHWPLHALEHGTLVGTALLVWWVILGPSRQRVARGAGLMLVFGLAMQSVFLSALLTFATTPWYAVYRAPAAARGLDALTDQQLAGVIMWIPAGLIHVVIAIGLLAAWMSESDDETAEPRARGHADAAPVCERVRA